ncbi:S-locus-specific glycoprotein S13-like [Cryptomeria japonica]|uniref:S-locus-specific glycoprotein S13-like n=1 Tax=Cryptomeria japonica TaxID=3369 RepID=UPI0027DAA267|nr:S-locus-specific glycoprotein S13-like [Cryptomeria japonica]
MVIEMGMKYLIQTITVIIVAHCCTCLAVEVGDTLSLGNSLTGNQHNLKEWHIPDKTIVWVANRYNPVESLPSILKFSSNRYLKLIDGKGVSVWSTDIGLRGSRGQIMDSGNFIILHAHNKSEIVWESFAHVCDTWLPGIKMWKAMRGTSWNSSVDPSSGLFSIVIDMSPGKTQLY